MLQEIALRRLSVASKDDISMTLQRALGSSDFYLRFHKCTSLHVNEAIGKVSSGNRADAYEINTQAVYGKRCTRIRKNVTVVTHATVAYIYNIVATMEIM